MGSSQKLKRKGQPKKIHSDGNGFNGGTGQHDDPNNKDGIVIDELTIELIRLNPDVLEQADSGDHVIVNHSNDGLGVDIKPGRLGYVPPHYEAAVKDNSLFSGTIVEIDEKPISVMVRLSNR